MFAAARPHRSSKKLQLHKSNHQTATRFNSLQLHLELNNDETAAMERKRKLPARAARVESVSKKRTSTPPEPRTQPTPPPPPPAIEESLPKSVVAGKPLPTVDEPQREHLSAKDFQTISER